MTINRGGFIETASGPTISKDPTAKLQYTLDWSDWLQGSDTIATQTFTAVSRRNDPTPIVIHDSGITDGVRTYVELSGGQLDKSYVIACAVTTANGLIDRRQFNLVVESRYA
jgi:hypothetical protein